MKLLFLIPGTLLAFLSASPAADPAWWTTRGVKTASPASNLSPATVGQAKHMAAMALAELELRIPPEDFDVLEAAVNAVVNLEKPVPLPPDWNEKHRIPLLSGELKALAKPFYDRLRAMDADWIDHQMLRLDLKRIEPDSSPFVYSPYPWSETSTDDDNKAPATLGQLKAVFSLDFSLLGSTAEPDSDNDGVPDDLEPISGTSPSLLDSDGDGVMDGLDAFPIDPTRSAHENPNQNDQTAPVVSLLAPANATQIVGP